MSAATIESITESAFAMHVIFISLFLHFWPDRPAPPNRSGGPGSAALPRPLPARSRVTRLFAWPAVSVLASRPATFSDDRMR